MLRFLLFMALFTAHLSARTDYTLPDLEVLVAEDSYREFFQHALDIRPSERQDAWKTMVVKMGDSFSSKVLEKIDVERNDFLKIEEVFNWPALRQDDVFKRKRQEIGIRYLRKCLKAEAPCWNDLKDFWEKDKSDADTAFKLAELTEGNKDSPIKSWQYYEVALKSPLSEFYCKKDFVLEALWAKIEMDYIRIGPAGDLMKKIDQTIHPDCVPTLILESRKRLERPNKPHDRELAFQILKSQMKADTAVTDFFYTVYLLDNPSQGELFNISWNRLKELGQNSERREKLMEKLRKLDPLPDQVFGSFDQMKKKVVLQHVKANFPEYLDFYADQCVLFYGGKGSFPLGNPTIHCQELMKSEWVDKIIPSYKIQKYEEVRKI